MQFLSSVLLGLGLIAGTQALPSKRNYPVPTVHLKFNGGPASYDLWVPLDDTTVPTNNGININIIDVLTPGYDAFHLCTFNTPGTKALVEATTSGGLTEISVGPPQPILSVCCRAN